MFARELSPRVMCWLMLACSSMALAQSAMAQTEGPTGVAAGASTQSSERATRAEDQGDTVGLADIIVTAQRFTETAQKTPLILSVIGAEELKGVNDLRQLQSVSPGVQISGSGTMFQTFIRGVGSINILNAQESAISYNADGVFLYTASMITPLMYDLDRIEVLKGPQGTLYGRNASGGAVNLITTGAHLGKAEGYLEGEIGNYSQRRLVGAVNLPLGDNLAVRIAGQHVEHDGYLSDGSADQDVTSGRIRIRWEPSSTVTLLVGADVSHQDPVGPGTSINPNQTGDKWVGAFDPRARVAPSTLSALPPYAPPFLKNDQWSVNAQLDVDMGFATLTIVPAYRSENVHYLTYSAGIADTQIARTRQKTIEARMANRNDKLKWVVGAFYLKSDQFLAANPRQELLGTNAYSEQEPDLTSYAFFGEATFSVSDVFRLTGGLRYTHEKKATPAFNNERFPPNSAALNPFNAVTNPTGDQADFVVLGRASASAVTWKAGAELDLSPSSLLFATASRGFKGGGTFVNRPGLNSSYRPEYVTAFELGSRNRFFGNTLQINGELFYWKLKDQQLTYLSFNEASQVILLTTNAGKAHMYGGTVDVVWKPTGNDTLRGAVEYTESKYDSFVQKVPRLFALPTSACGITFSGPGPFSSTTLDCSGLPVLRAPKWTASAGYQHRFDLGNGGDLTFNADMTYASGRYLFVNYTPLGYQGGQALFNGSLTYTAPNQAVTVTGWIRNIGNERVMTNAIQSNAAFSRPALAPPRTYGASVRLTF